jgi:hypothetical protein
MKRFLRSCGRVCFAFALVATVFGSSVLAQSGSGQDNSQKNQKGASAGQIKHEGVTPTGNTVHHFFTLAHEKEYRAQKAAAAAAASGTQACPPTCPPTGTALIYNGGPVMRNPTNYLIFWVPQSPLGPANNVSAGFPAGFQAGIETFFQNLGGTPFYNIVTQYNDSSGAVVPNAESLGASSWTDTTTIAPSGCDGTAAGTYGSTPHCPLQDSDIQAEVTTALAANPAWIQPPQINVEYFVFTPTGIGECSNQVSGVWQCFVGSGPTQAGVFCAYHSAFNTSSSNGTIYAYEPFSVDSNCHGSNVGPTPNLNNYPTSAAVDGQISQISHEMIESNTDPLPGANTAWQGALGGADEIGDKCSYDYGYVAPDGTDVVLNGNRYQIQQEFSNDQVLACGGASAPPYCACAKRYGPGPGLSEPVSVDFGEVDGGNIVEKDVVIQNTTGGDLNILNFKFNPAASSPDYTILNASPSAATLPAGESVTLQVQFAPPYGALFAHPYATLDVDTDQTTFNTGTQTIGNENTITATGTVGVAPVANCQNATVPTDLNLCTASVASVNNGSYDPDTEAFTLTQSPAGPYTLGMTPVTLLIEDSVGDSASCSATVTVKDMQKPTITCPAPQSIMCTSSSGAAANLTPTVFDNCPAVTSSCVPPSGSTFGFGTTPATCTATDASGNKSSCVTSVTVVDVPPVITSVVASPNVLRPPNKKLDPVVILVKDTDVCDPAPICAISSVTTNAGVAPPGSYVITGPLSVKLQAGGNGGHAETYIIGVTCTDHHGGATTAQTTVQAPL